ncbi:MAG: hypothetical protein L0Z62_46925 [Gemmataceae bacterium]|nr:hypothetical protein [Gemmataceae bacterium]
MTKKETTTSATSPAHTPGPWRTDTIGLDRIWVLDEEENYLAEIVTEDECGFVVLQGQQEANARLMAAAPELLEACKGICDLLYRDKNGDERVDLGQFEQASLACKRAIALAEGAHRRTPCRSKGASVTNDGAVLGDLLDLAEEAIEYVEGVLEASGEDNGEGDMLRRWRKITRRAGRRR